MLAANLYQAYLFLELILYLAVAIAGAAGAVFAATTRDDAYPAADRQTKWLWVGLLAASAFVVFTQVPFLSWAGMVVIGVYWFDVRPHLKSLLSGNHGW